MDERTLEQVRKEGEENIRQQEELMKKERDGSITPDERALLDHLDTELRDLAGEASTLGLDTSETLEAARRRRDRELGVTEIEEIREVGDDKTH